MAFEQFKLERTVDQTRGIFDQYEYTTPDTIEDVVQPGYFHDVRFTDFWENSILFAQCADGFLTCQIDAEGLYVLYNSTVPFQTAVLTVTEDHDWVGSNMVYIDGTAGDVAIQLPLAADYPNEEIFFKLIVSTTSIATILPSGSDNFEGQSVFTKFAITLKNQFVKIKSDGVGAWQIIARRSFTGAGITITPPSSIDVTATPTTIVVFDTVLVSTRTRLEANILTNSLEILVTEISTVEAFDIRFSGTFEYANNANLNIQVYCDGVGISTLAASSQGQGPNNNHSFGIAQMVLITAPCTITLKIWGDTAQSTPVGGLVFEALRVAG